ncbi:BTAD domain-containing putative transcriptional regulator [Streptomyces sp. LHD-70]|uniref:AfsR/SARP family transcriptional regulator n=1 Tax=Streptomyces sp. LHD-70 TaxID=3072140 RepID=UPI0028104307|nr:BTAD domain-containing putative transcriptional regulator [Streptomyces sp. LHD-70]MDQ8707219.1 BTAD domain-containing putative transcriptional regulator [Streptomyces sp. LHD-70]
MDIKVLGVLTVTESGTPVAPVAAEPRQVLALLAMLAGRVVPSGLLIEEVWPGKRPHQAKHMLKSYVGQLREHLAVALRDRGRKAAGRGRGERQAADLLAALPGGYRLDGGQDTCDAWEFERSVGAGYRAMATGDLDTAARRLREALGLWRGEPFADVVPGPHLGAQIERLRQSRERATGQWIEAELRMGRYRELAADLPTLHIPGRLRERLPALLNQCGDPGQALAAYQQLLRQDAAPRVTVTHPGAGHDRHPFDRALYGPPLSLSGR